MSGIVGGITYGVAKNIQLKGIKVLDGSGQGSSFTISSGIMYIINNQDSLRGGDPAIKKLVANLSLGGQASNVIDSAVNQLISNNIAVSVASGNEGNDACLFSPSRNPNVLSVAASDINDLRPSFSNFGSCVSFSAPGVDITSAWIGSPTAIATESGTSMSSPLACGVMALIWQQNKALTNIQVQNLVKQWTTQFAINSGFDDNTRNLLFSLVNPNISPPPTLNPNPPVPNPNPNPIPTILPGNSNQITLSNFIIIIIFIYFCMN